MVTAKDSTLQEHVRRHCKIETRLSPKESGRRCRPFETLSSEEDMICVQNGPLERGASRFSFSFAFSVRFLLFAQVSEQVFGNWSHS